MNPGLLPFQPVLSVGMRQILDLIREIFQLEFLRCLALHQVYRIVDPAAAAGQRVAGLLKLVVRARRYCLQDCLRHVVRVKLLLLELAVLEPDASALSKLNSWRLLKLIKIK